MVSRKNETKAHAKLLKAIRYAVQATATVASFALVGLAHAASYKVIYTFKNAPDASTPYGGLISDSLGRLYGTTFFGGRWNYGTVYRLTPPVSGTGPWTEEKLHSFNGSEDGLSPGGSLLLGPSGEIYGVALGGFVYGGGSAYRLDPTSAGWILTTLHVFGAPPQGGAPPDALGPDGGLVFGKDGLLYGVSGSVSGYLYDGTVFNISPLGDTAEYAILHRFDDPNEGGLPNDAMLPVGNGFFGTTLRGPGGGTVFRIRPAASGGWKEDVLHQFGAPGDFSYPLGTLVRGKNGVFYGCAGGGGAFGQGGVYALTRQASGSDYAESILYSFGAKPKDSIAVNSCGLAMNPAGQLFGAPDQGGSKGVGTFFELDPPAQGATTWTETILHNFLYNGTSGSGPNSAPLKMGGLYYGVTIETTEQQPLVGGVVYQIRP